MGFFEEYFLNPIVEKTGYNIVNTLVYAIIAVIACYFIFFIMKKKFNKKLLIYIIPFVLFGSSMRVLTDLVDSGEKVDFFLTNMLISTGFYNYSFFTVTPGIYILVTIIFLISVGISELTNEKVLLYIGIFLFLIHFLALVPFFKNFIFLFLILFISSILFLSSYLILKKYKILNVESQLVVFSHILDASSSFTALEIVNESEICKVFGRCYFGQHVVERFLSSLPFGLVLFIVIKVFLSIVACYLINKIKDENEKYFLYILIMVMGLAPGFRNTLRVLLGV